MPGKTVSPRLKELENSFLKNGGSFKEYRIGELFIINTGSLLKSSELFEGEIKRVSARSINNGIIGLFDTAEMKNARHYNNFISVNFFGDVFYHPYKASVEMKVHVLQLKENNFTKGSGLYISAAINQVIKNKFGYGNQLSSSKLKNENFYISLPTLDGRIDFTYMERCIEELEAERIEELEAERIEELEAYLQTTGLKNYALNEKDVNALDKFNQIVLPPPHEKFNESGIVFKEFKISNLFCVKAYKKRFDANKVIISKKGHPYVVRTNSNNGIKGYINESEEFLNDGNTISFGQDTATVFYQEKPYFTGDKIKILKSKEKEFNKLSALFYTTVIKKSFSSFSWGSSSFSEGAIGAQNIILPSKNATPDYRFMESFITAIQKLVIKDVVLLVDQKLQAYKNIKKGKVRQPL